MRAGTDISCVISQIGHLRMNGIQCRTVDRAFVMTFHNCQDLSLCMFLWLMDNVTVCNINGRMSYCEHGW